MYVLDMKRTIFDGYWQGGIGKADRSTVRIFTEKEMKGSELTNFYISGKPEDAQLKVYGPDGDIYISFEQLETHQIPPQSAGMYITEKTLIKLLDQVNDYDTTEIELKMKELSKEVNDFSGIFIKENNEWEVG